MVSFGVLVVRFGQVVGVREEKGQLGDCEFWVVVVFLQLGCCFDVGLGAGRTISF